MNRADWPALADPPPPYRQPYLPRFPDAPDRDIPADVRDHVMARDERICQYCGFSPATTLDHVNAFANGGTHHVRNLVVACVVCNSIAGLRSFPEFAAKGDYVRARRDQLTPTQLRRLRALLDAGGKYATFAKRYLG